MDIQTAIHETPTKSYLNSYYTLNNDTEDPRFYSLNDTINNSFGFSVPSLLSSCSPGPRPLVICGPSGSGKSTLLKRLMQEYGDILGFSVSHTTRKPREGEVNGREYNFVDIHSMENDIQNGKFIEYTNFAGNYYGTSWEAVRRVQSNGKICVLDVEMEGVRNLKQTHLNPRFVFLKPPSLEVLEKRLSDRGTENEESIRRRLDKAKVEILFGETPGNFDIIIVNDDINEAYKMLKDFLLQDLEAVRNSYGA